MVLDSNFSNYLSLEVFYGLLAYQFLNANIIKVFTGINRYDSIETLWAHHDENGIITEMFCFPSLLCPLKTNANNTMVYKKYILDFLKMIYNVKPKSTPASSSKLLSSHSDLEPFDDSFNYRSLIGKLNYLEKEGLWPEIAYITHQWTQFTMCPKKEHRKTIW